MTPLLGFEFVTPHRVPSSPATQIALYEHEDSAFRCVRCNHRGCDVKVHGCECSFHARCIAIDKNQKIESCPHCKRPTTGLILNPMSFTEIDEARKSASTSKQSSKRGRKRKNSVLSESESYDDSGSIVSADTPAVRSDDKEHKDLSTSNCRTGRWTDEEIKFCDALISLFKQGQLPLAKGVKLNDFLTSMLKSKQSRLTKKMKNAKLSSVTFNPLSSYIKSESECQTFSTLEENFFEAIQDSAERAELKFHVRREWRDMFCNFCVQSGKKLDADGWLTSVDEMDRRNSIARDATRMKRRKVMMVNAITHDSCNVEAGVFIERSETEIAAMRANNLSNSSCAAVGSYSTETDDILSLLIDDIPAEGTNSPACILDDITPEVNGKSSIMHSSPFLLKIQTYMKRRNIPFEQVDIWVPSLSQGDEPSSEQKCRLSFAGCTTMDSVIPATELGPPEAMSAELKFNLLSFGDYSQKFSFESGCGLPGRVYRTGVSTWEQNVQAAPTTHFERCGGAKQWGIKTVVGIPIPSPNVGRIVMVLYSVHNRNKCEETVRKLQNEFTRLLPTPKWKLVVDVSDAPLVKETTSAVTTQKTAAASSNSATTNGCDIESLISLLGNEMPSNPLSSLPSQMQSLMSLRLLLLRPRRNAQEEDVVNTILASYASYTKSGRGNSEVSVMLAHDFTFLTQSQSTPNLSHSQSSGQMSHQQLLPALHYSSTPNLPTHFQQVKSQVQENLNISHLQHNHQSFSLQDEHIKHSTNVDNGDFFYPKSSMYSGFDDARLDNNFRSDSPTLSPIGAPGDNLSIVSN